jgi:hypothetical protein
MIRRWVSFSNEPHKPTNAPGVPTKMTLAQLLASERFSHEAKVGYVKLNIPMPCPPRGTVPVNTGAWFCEFVSSQHARFAFGEGCDCASCRTSD